MTPTEALRLDYMVGLPDLMAVTERSINQSLNPGAAAAYMAGATIIGCMVALLTLEILGASAWPDALGLGALSMLIWWATLKNSARRRVMRRMEKRLQQPANAPMYGPRSLCIDDNGFSIGSPHSDLNYRWLALQRVVVTRQRLFLYVSGMQAHVLPLMAADADRVVQRVRLHAPLVVIADEVAA